MKVPAYGVRYGDFLVDTREYVTRIEATQKTVIFNGRTEYPRDQKVSVR